MSEASYPSFPGLEARGGLIANRRHLLGFLLIGVAVAGLGVLAQHAPSANGAAAGQLASHEQALQIYLTAICMDWAMLYYCWAGVHRQGGTLASLAGARPRGARVWLSDIAVAIACALLWELAGLVVTRWLGPNAAKTVDSLLPRSPLEIAVWCAACVTAGVCEEIGFRGYLQRQLRALTGSTAFAVVGQGVVFGLFHFYQGWKNVVVISMLGVLFGLLALWRGNLRANIASHAMLDLWEGWLKFVV